MLGLSTLRLGYRLEAIASRLEAIACHRYWVGMRADRVSHEKHPLWAETDLIGWELLEHIPLS